jgi:hypothetical protein
VRDAKNEALQRAEEIYQRLMREMRTDLERRMRMRAPFVTPAREEAFAASASTPTERPRSDRHDQDW